jgi:hypothetical protein
MARTLTLGSIAISLLIGACGGETPQPTPPVTTASTPPVATTPPPDPTPTASTVAATPPDPPKPTPPIPAAKYEGFATPECVLYDADADRYIVSNISGKPLDVDNNGFISVLAPDGQVTNLKWIEGGKNKVKLDAPKGMTIVKGTLYVADITVVRMFDAKSGAPKGEIKIPGATFLNDIASGPDGRVYVSDSGLKQGDKSLDPTGTDAVWIIDKGKAKTLAKSTDLGKPNGLIVVSNGVVAVTFGTGEIYRLDDKGVKQDAMKLPKGMLDGVVAIGGDMFLVSSWEGSAIYRGKLGGTFDVVVSDQAAPADIGWDSKRSRVLVPHFVGTTVEAYDVK